MTYTRRRLLGAAVGGLGVASLAGCTGNGADRPAAAASGPTAQASFFVFGDLTSKVAGNAAAAELLVPVGQHGHGWEPGPRVREAISGADLFVHGMDGFQPWVDDILADLEADGTDVTTVDASAGVDLVDAGDHDEGGDRDHGAGVDPHFWMDPLRAKETVGTVQQALSEVDGDNEDVYAANAEAARSTLDGLHDRIESTVASGSTDAILVAGHDAFRYLGDRYGVEIEALTDVSPDDLPTPRDVGRAQEIIDTHDLRYICADPLESQEAAEQLVAETDATDVLPLTSIPGLTTEWNDNEWGYVEVMENVNLPTLERALGD